MKVSVYVAASVDGFIAKADGSLDWLNEANEAIPPGEDLGFRAFMNSVDALVMGQKTFQQVVSLGRWPYGRTPVAVLSRGALSLPPGVPDTVTHSSEPLQDLLQRLSDDGVEHLYVDGATTIRGFLSEGLVDEITLMAVPVILGHGIPLFGPLEEESRLTHLRTTVFDFGFVQTTYSLEQDT